MAAHSSKTQSVKLEEQVLPGSGAQAHVEFQAKHALLNLLSSSDMVSSHQAVLCYTKAYLVEFYNLKHGEALPWKRQFIEQYFMFDGFTTSIN